MTRARVALMGILFTALFWTPICAAWAFRFGTTRAVWGLFTFGALACPSTFFLVYRLTFAVAWNLRAKRLQSTGSRSTNGQL
jgi:hypothetical protein